MMAVSERPSVGGVLSSSGGFVKGNERKKLEDLITFAFLHLSSTKKSV